MKYLALIFLAFLILSFESSTNITTNKLNPRDLSNSYLIKTVTFKQIELKKFCLIIEESTYPKITGLKDEPFQKQLNNIFSFNFNSYIDTTKLSECTPFEVDEDNSWANQFSSQRCWFTILSKTEGVISIVQNFLTYPEGGGNAWDPSSIVTTCDLKNKKVLDNTDLGMSFNNIDIINKGIKKYFDILFPEERKNNEINYPIIETQMDFDNLNFGIRNDSIMLVIEAYPSAHYTYHTYIIPIDKWNRD